MRRKQFLVIGLGRFGTAVALTLASDGHEVVAMDSNETTVQAIMHKVAHAAVADATDERTLRALGIDTFDTVVVAIGTNVEASAFITLTAKDAGARHLVCKATSELMKRVLEHVGADAVIRPEYDSGIQLARTLAAPQFIAELELTKDLKMVELALGRQSVGSLGKLALDKRFGVQVVVHVRDETVRTTLSNETEVRAGDKLVLVGKSAALEKLREALGD
jgi:trk system potassium uptake protein